MNRLSKPDQQWATLFVRSRTPMLRTDGGSPPSSPSDETEAEVTMRTCTNHNRVHVFDRRLLPLIRRTRPGDRIFVTGFISYYKPSMTSSPPEVVKVRLFEHACFVFFAFVYYVLRLVYQFTPRPGWVVNCYQNTYLSCLHDLTTKVSEATAATQAWQVPGPL